MVPSRYANQTHQRATLHWRDREQKGDKPKPRQKANSRHKTAPPDMQTRATFPEPPDGHATLARPKTKGQQAQAKARKPTRRKMALDIGSGGRSVPDKRSEATLMVTAAYIASQMRGQAAGDHRSSGHVRRHQSKCRQSDQRLDHKPPLPFYNQKPTPRALSSYRYSSQ